MKRRSFLLGLTSALAAPAVVHADSLMKLATLRQSIEMIEPAYNWKSRFIGVALTSAMKGEVATVLLSSSIEDAQRQMAKWTAKKHIFTGDLVVKAT